MFLMLIFADGNERVHALYFKYRNFYFASLIFKKKNKNKKRKKKTKLAMTESSVGVYRLQSKLAVAKFFTEVKQNLK